MLTINLTDVVGSSGDIGYVPYIVANDKLGNSTLRQVGTRIVNNGTYTSADGKTVLSIINGSATLSYTDAVGNPFITLDQTNFAGGYNNVATAENIYFYFDASGFLVSSATLPVNINTPVFNFNGAQVATVTDLAGYEPSLGFTPENVANKTDVVTGNEADSTLYLSVKGYYDYLIALTWLTAQTFGTFLTGLTSKTTPIDADEITIVDTADTNKAKKVSLTNFKAFLKTYFDTVYEPAHTSPELTFGKSKQINRIF